MASRLESSGIMGRIQVSEQVAQILLRHGQFEVECRGPIEVRGKGLLTTYLVVTPYDNGLWELGFDSPVAATASIINGGSCGAGGDQDPPNEDDEDVGGGQLAMEELNEDDSMIELAAEYD